MVEVNLYSVARGNHETTVGQCISRARFDKDAMGVSVMKFVKGFLKDNLTSFETALGNAEIINFINNDDLMTQRDFSCINYYLIEAGFYVQIQNVTDDEENADGITGESVEWNIIDYNFIQNDYPTAVKIIPGDGLDIPAILEKAVEGLGLFDGDKFSGVKNPLTVQLGNLKRIKEVTGAINPGVTTKIYELLDNLGVKIFCATSAD